MINEDGYGDEKLQELLALMKADHSFITSNLTSKDLQKYYFSEDGLDQQVKHYFGLLESFIAREKQTNIDEITNYSFALLSNLDKAVKIFENEYDKKVEEAKQRELFIYIGTLVTLVLEAIFIIAPMIRINRRYVYNLENEVKKRTKDIEVFAKIFDNSQEGMVVTDADENIIDVNKAFSKITGYSKDEALGKTPRILQSKKHDKKFYEDMWSEINQNSIWQGEVINKRKDGEEVNEHLTIMKLEDENSFNYVSVFSDITKTKRQNELLEFLASHDNLTNLLNRNEMLIRINDATNEARANQKRFTLIFIDLDNFKYINDSMGHSMGDKLLVEISKKIRLISKERYSIARIGGDEFIVLYESDEDKSYIDRLLNIFSEPFVIDNREISVSASIGVAYSSDDEQSSIPLMQKADLAMYSAKEKGKNKVVFYTKELEESMRSKVLIENQLKKAIENSELELYFQAKIDLQNSHVDSAEVLLRWYKDGEFISPDDFIKVAEETNLIKTIDKWVIENSLEKVKTLHSKGLNEFCLAINLSGHTFSDPKAMDEILSKIEKSDVARYIELEITEGALIENIDIVTLHLEKMKKLGISVSLDDFGTGYSSFSYLSQMSVNTLKIDRSFIMTLENKKQEVIVQAILSFSKLLGIKVVAEGVETNIQAEWLKAQGCDYAQGYLFSKPLPFKEFTKYLKV
jgi:diguanylate cyclase (GGDEF)-like protein/PAS domain S-box-containing protein